MEITIKALIKALLPRRLIHWQHQRIAQRRRAEYQHLSTEQLFTRIYADRAWGSAGDRLQPFFSGLGSHEKAIVEPYVDSVSTFLKSLSTKPDVVDLGCGDFYVGARLRPLCNRYTACDIVAPLIEFNREKYHEFEVDFRVLDLTQDVLPVGEIVFIRLVLQHLSNAQILRALPQLANYRYLVISEHLPAAATFTANIDKPAGQDIRLDLRSGVVLTSPPFQLAVRDQRVLCEVPDSNGIIRTTLYTMP